jgi:hypothetical protein
MDRTAHLIATTLHVALFRNDTLLAGPFTGEFGLEVLDWSGYVRSLASKYQRTIVISYPGNRCLYEPCEYYAHENMLENSGYWFGSLSMSDARVMAEQFAAKLGLAHFDWLHPHHLNKITRHRIGPQQYPNPFGFGQRKYEYDIAFHFRNMLRADLDSKNYPIEYAEALTAKCASEGLRICCIGHPKYSLCPSGCDDMRSADLKNTVECLGAVKIVVGGSSGPMHLASTYGVPIVVWVDGRMSGAESTAQIYLGAGNPHKRPVFLVSDTNFQPPPKQVFSYICKALALVDHS